MMQPVDVLSMQKKFATALSKLFTDAKIPLENITEKIVADDFFDFMERQAVDELTETSYELLASRLFGAAFVFNEGVNPAIYWAGLQYMSISLNLGMPLKQVALLCPLGEMCAHFDIYHEMAGQQLLEEFASNEARRSILRTLRNQASISTRMLAELTGISEPTVKHYEKSNENLFNASSSNIVALADVLGCSTSLFRRRSLFVPFTEALFEEIRFKELFEERVSKILGKQLLSVEYDLPLIRVCTGHSASSRSRLLSEVCTKRAFLQAFDLMREEQPGILWF